MKKRDTSIARKIWLQYHKCIPKDINGKSYEIHHIDGNCENNDISNLIAVSINMHYQIHYLQKDYAACNLIAERIEKPIIKGYKNGPLSKETRKKMQKSAILRFSKKEERENTSKLTKEAMNRSEVKETISKSQKVRFSKKEERENTSKLTKEAMNRSDVREKVLINNIRIGKIISTLKTIHKDNKEKRVPIDKIEEYIKEGWKLGRSPHIKLGRKPKK